MNLCALSKSTISEQRLLHKQTINNTCNVACNILQHEIQTLSDNYVHVVGIAFFYQNLINQIFIFNNNHFLH